MGTVAVEIHATPEAVWNEVSDPARWPMWMTKYDTADLLEAERIAPGAKVRLTYHVEELRESRDPVSQLLTGGLSTYTETRVETAEVQAVEKQSMLRLSIHGVTHTYRFVPTSRGTRVTLETPDSGGLFARLMSRFRRGSGELAHLKSYIEDAPQPLL